MSEILRFKRNKEQANVVYRERGNKLQIVDGQMNEYELVTIFRRHEKEKRKEKARHGDRGRSR